MEEQFTSFEVELNMKENLEMIESMDMEFKLAQMKIDTKDN